MALIYLIGKKYKDLIVKEPVDCSKNGQTITDGVAITTKKCKVCVKIKTH